MIEMFKKAIDEIIESAFNETVERVIECGHHDLNRNYVFKIETQSMTLIVKFFYKRNKQVRELNALKFYKSAKLKIVKTGVLADGTEWSLYNCIKGEIMQSLYHTLTLSNKKSIFKEIGREMAELHSSCDFNYFGDWMDDKQSALKFYKSFIIDDTERLIYNLKQLHNYDQHVFDKAIEITRSEYINIRELRVGRLCHRDFDGRNIIVNKKMNHEYEFTAVLDFEKCVVFNEYLDIIGLYRKYFMENPKLIPAFFSGYTEVLPLDDSFNKEFKFNLFRLGLDLCSWSQNVSFDFYNESYTYVQFLLNNEMGLDQYQYKKTGGHDEVF